MSIGEFFGILVGCILANNYVLSHFFGFENLKRDSEKSIRFNLDVALFATLVLIVATTVCFPLDKWILSVYAPWARTMCYVIVVFFSVLLVKKALMERINKNGKWESAAIALNSIVLGTLLLNNASGYGWLGSYAAVIGCGIGYFLTAAVLIGVKNRINMKAVPESFRGVPIYLAALAICSMAIYAFA